MFTLTQPTTTMSAAVKPSHAALPTRYSHQESNDFDEQAGFLAGWNQDYAQISAGHFKGSVTQIDLPDVSLFLEYTNQQLHQQGVLSDDVIAIGVPMAAMGKGMFCGNVCEQHAVHIYSGELGFEFLSPPNLWIGLFVVSKAMLLQSLSDEDQAKISAQCQHARIMPISAHAHAVLVRFLKSVFATLKTLPSFVHDPLIATELKMTALQLVTDTLLDIETDEPLTPYPHQSWQVLTKTRHIVQQRLDDPITVLELCETLAMSHRNLQYHFKKALDKSPIAYLRTERLNAVRHMLKHASSVTEAATTWGFWHFGHFSQEYKKMFGELPSATFKRFHN